MKEKEVTKESCDYGFYSKVLNKPFDTLEALKDAEEEFHKEEEAKTNALAVKKARAKEVEDAYLEYQKVREAAYNEIVKAEKKWVELRDKFADDYHGYHMTYVNNNGEKRITFDDLVNARLMTW